MKMGAWEEKRWRKERAARLWGFFLIRPVQDYGLWYGPCFTPLGRSLFTQHFFFRLESLFLAHTILSASCTLSQALYYCLCLVAFLLLISLCEMQCGSGLRGRGRG